MKIKCYTCDKEFNHCPDPGSVEGLQPLSLGYCSWGCLLEHKDETIGRLHQKVASLECLMESEKRLREYEAEVIEVRATLYQMLRSSKEMEKRVKVLLKKADNLPLSVNWVKHYAKASSR